MGKIRGFINRSEVVFSFFIGFTALLMSACKFNNDSKNEISSIGTDIDQMLEIRYQHLLNYPVDSLAFPRSMSLKTGEILKVPAKDWTSGFLPGNLWYLYQLTGNEEYKEKAIAWTELIEKEKYNGGTHDMGFKVFCSFGTALEFGKNKEYEAIIVQSAKTLGTRFNEKVGSLRSWDFNSDIWEFPVIIDNMMNLELLFEATKISGDSVYHNMAVKHANTTLKNHFRPNNSTWHVVVYDTIQGNSKAKVTHQGYNDDSSWARGQAWAIYGYTMAYRYTKDERYLNQAKATTSFFLEHENLPEDGVSYWDFDDPKIPNTPRDVSAATIVASALLELNSYSVNQKYIDYVDTVLKTLKSPKYIIDSKVDGPFILDHSTGVMPFGREIDEPIVYADYYYLEALARKKEQ